MKRKENKETNNVCQDCKSKDKSVKLRHGLIQCWKCYKDDLDFEEEYR